MSPIRAKDVAAPRELNADARAQARHELIEHLAVLVLRQHRLQVRQSRPSGGDAEMRDDPRGS
jgi:hypothetical protein